MIRTRRYFFLAAVSMVLLAIAASSAFAGECPLSGTNYRSDYASAAGLPRCNGTIGKWSPCEVCLISDGRFTEQEAYTQSYPASGTGLQPHATLSSATTSPVQVDGFFDGLTTDCDPLQPNKCKAIFRIRLIPTTSSGTWSFSTTSPDGGLTYSGSFMAGTSSETGFLRRDPDHPQKFIWDDGTHPFIWGQTFYQIVNLARSGDDSRWKPSITNSALNGINKIRLLVSPWFGDPRFTNADSKAFQKSGANLNRDLLDIVHWRSLDQVTGFIKDQKMIADLILFHDGDNTTSPFAGTRASTAQGCTSQDGAVQNRRYTRYVLARYAAFPNVIWTLSNEYQLVTGPSQTCNAAWNDLGCLIHGGCSLYGPGADPWIVNGSSWRPLSNHNNINTTNSDNPINGSYPCFEFFNAGWPGHVSLQTKRGLSVTVDVETFTAVSRNSNLTVPNPNYNPNLNLTPCPGLSSSTRLPVINDEYYYVGQLPNDDATDRLRHREAVWSIATTGGFGSAGSLRGVSDARCTAAGCNGTCCPTLYTTWVEEPGHYGDIHKMTDFFKNTLQDLWWLMDISPHVSKVNGNTRNAYGLEGGGQYVVYAIRDPNNAGKTATFNVDLCKGMYPTYFYDPTNPGQGTSSMKKVTRCRPTPFTSPKRNSGTWNDWVARISAPVVRFATGGDETVWVWDDLPAGAIPYGDSESWNWIAEDPVPISDSLAHQSNAVAGIHQHYFQSATETLSVAAGNVLYAYIYLDPLNPPSEVMLQWNDGSWEHRAYWGANQIGWGADGTNSRRYMGPLPASDQWVRLEVPASSVGLEGHTLNGMAFTLFGGKATWDEAGASAPSGPVCGDPGVITLQPQSQTIIPGASATLSVAVSGTGPFQYQFYQSPVGTYNNPTGISTATINTGPLYTTKQYWAEIIDNCYGTFLHSDAATITVQCTAAPTITQNPTTRVTTPGQQTTLSVAATQGVNYQWYVGNSPTTGTPISGGTNPTLTVSPQSSTNYCARVTNGCGLADSAAATVCVLPQITAQPTPRTINPGQSTTLSVSALNPGTYQWYVGSSPSTATPFAGGTASSLTVTLTATTSYWVRVTNSCGSADSNSATVTVAPPPPPQITRIQSVSVLANSQQSITANWTQPTQPGTFLVAVISSETYPNGYVTFTPPAGWSNAVTSEWNNIKLAVYYLPNNAGARASETFSVSPGFHDMTLYVMEYSGIMAANPLDKTGLTGNSTNSGYVQTGFTANTVQPKELVITALTTYTQTSFSTTPADGYTELYDQSMLYHLTTAMYEKITTAIGSYGHGATVTVPAEWVGLVATFRAADTN